ncbi:hypothetical protein HQ590_02190 [bacterium]|nr:hypothetical protein [bacterium]
MGVEHEYPREYLLAAIVLLVIGLALLIRWLTRALARIQPRPNPWGPEIDETLAQPDATPVCHRCFTPQPELPGWFCPCCGGAIGPDNNWMAYLQIFSIGEVLSTGTFHRFRVNGWTLTGFLLLSIGQYQVFAPVYWFWLCRNVRRIRQTPVEDVP